MPAAGATGPAPTVRCFAAPARAPTGSQLRARKVRPGSADTYREEVRQQAEGPGAVIMNAFDTVLLVVIALLMLVGLLKGLTRLAIGIAALVAACVLATRFHRPVAASFAAVAELAEPVASAAAYAAIFLGTMLAGALVAFVVRRTLKLAMLGWVDRLAGAAVGLVAALLAAGLLLVPAAGRVPAGQSLLRESVLAPYAAAAAALTYRLVPAPLSAEYRERMESLRVYWLERRPAPPGPAGPPG